MHPERPGIVLPEHDKKARRQVQHLSRRLTDLNDLLGCLDRLAGLTGDARDICLIDIGRAEHKAFHARLVEPQVLRDRSRQGGTPLGGPKAAKNRKANNTARVAPALDDYNLRIEAIWNDGGRNHRKAAGIVSDEIQRETGDRRHSEGRIYEATAKKWKALKSGRNSVLA